MGNPADIAQREEGVMINNEIRDYRGNLIGFRCPNCGNLCERGWGNTCNRCRKEERRYRELLRAIRDRRK